MLSVDEFFVGVVVDVKLLSFVFFRDGYDVVMLIGILNGVLVVVFLLGQFCYGVFLCVDNCIWGGVIVLNVCIEMDYISFNSNSFNGVLGLVMCKDM